MVWPTVFSAKAREQKPVGVCDAAKSRSEVNDTKERVAFAA